MQQPDSAGAVVGAVPGTTWTVGGTVTTALVLIVALAAAVAILIEINGIRKKGGIKEYVKDINATQYGAVRGIWTGEVVIGGMAVAVILHAILPNIVRELQMDALVAVLTAALATRGINFGQFWVQRKTEDPVISATNAMLKDPTVQPMVTVNSATGEKTVTPVPTSVVVPNEPVAVVTPVTVKGPQAPSAEYVRDE